MDAGRFATKDYPDDGTTVDLNGGIGLGIGRGSLSLFGEFQHRDPTNRAWPDIFLVDPNGVGDVIDTLTGTIIKKQNSLPQPNYHWGDGLEKDVMTFANFRMPLNSSGSSEWYAFGGYSHKVGTGNGFWRYFDSARNWPELYPQGFLPEFRPTVQDYSGATGIRTSLGGWSLDLGGSYGLNTFDYDLRNTNNASLGPCLDTPCAPGADGVLGTSDDPGIPNQLSFFAGRLKRSEILAGLNLGRSSNWVSVPRSTSRWVPRSVMRITRFYKARPHPGSTVVTWPRTAAGRRRPGLRSSAALLRPTPATTAGAILVHTPISRPISLPNSWPTWPADTSITVTSVTGSPASWRSGFSPPSDWSFGAPPAPVFGRRG